jgi:acetyl esterase/lipase
MTWSLHLNNSVTFRRKSRYITALAMYIMSIINHSMIIRRFVFVISILPVLAFAQKAPEEIPLWVNGAPGFESRRNEPSVAKDWWIKNIHNPSVTIYPAPSEKATGTSVIVCPGGGHRELVFNAEGREAAEYLNSIGVTAFVLKYRLANEENSPYSLEKHVRQDAYRAMRLVRSRAKEWRIDPDRIGMLGFSAGGEVVALIAYASGEGDSVAPDPIDRLSGKPDFQMLIYPGPHFIPENIPKDSPPAFLLAANDDPCCAESTFTLLQRYRAANLPVEAHLYTKGAHGFNMGNRSSLVSIKTWSQRMGDWMADSGLLEPSKNR